MKIAIIEIMDAGHFTLVDSLVRVFTSDPKNRITIFTHNEGHQRTQPLQKEFPASLTVTRKEDKESIRTFLSRAGKEQFDRIYIVTMYTYFGEFFSTTFSSPVFLVVHDIDEWFLASWKYRIYHLFQNFSLSPKYVYSIKQFIFSPFWKKKIARKVLASGGKIVVLSDSIKKELSTILHPDQIEVIPFSLYNANIQDTSDRKKIRLCIPGALSTTRRDYFSVLTMFEKDFADSKDMIELDLLGRISDTENGMAIINTAERLRAQGFSIYLPSYDFIPNDVYDEQLAKADLILGTTYVQRDRFSAYGKTKETGIPFTMIHAAKPGLFINEMVVPNELSTSTVFFRTYDELATILKEFMADHKKLDKLKQEAKKNAQYFSPAVIYSRLTH